MNRGQKRKAAGLNKRGLKRVVLPGRGHQEVSNYQNFGLIILKEDAQTTRPKYPPYSTRMTGRCAESAFDHAGKPPVCGPISIVRSADTGLDNGDQGLRFNYDRAAVLESRGRQKRRALTSMHGALTAALLVGSLYSSAATDGVNDRGPIQQIRGVPTHFTRQGATRTTPTSPKQKRHSDPVPTNDFERFRIGPAATHTNPSPLAHSAAHRLCELREKSTAEGLRPALARASVGPRSGPERSSGQSGSQAFRGRLFPQRARSKGH